MECKHYAKVPQGHFDEAIRWLGEEYGIKQHSSLTSGYSHPSDLTPVDAHGGLPAHRARAAISRPFGRNFLLAASLIAQRSLVVQPSHRFGDLTRKNNISGRI